MLGLIALVPLVVVVVLFASSNGQLVQVRLWPFDLAWEASLAVVVLVAAALAFLFGALVAWGSALPARRRAGRLERAGKVLESELDVMKAQLAVQREAAQRDVAV